MAKKNVASGRDNVAVQAGTVYDGQSKTAEAEESKAASAKDAKTSNVRSGNAKVGVQADEISGGISFGRRW